MSTKKPPLLRPVSDASLRKLAGGMVQNGSIVGGSSIFMGSDFGTTPGYNDGNGQDGWGEGNPESDPAPLPALPVFIFCGTCI